jgi:hypothetical protein
MGITDRFRTRPADPDANAASDAPSSPDEHQLPIPRYDRLSEREIKGQLHELSQVQLAAVENYERAHADRAVVLDRLRYMRSNEPLIGYDSMSEGQILETLPGADGQTLRAVRDYERKFRRHPTVSAEIARVLPTSQASAEETQALEDKAALVANRPGA